MSEFAIGVGRSSRGAVGAALRILMSRHGIGVEDAFELLVRAARRSRLDVRDVAVGVMHADRRRGGGRPRTCQLDRPARGLPRRAAHCTSPLSAQLR